MNNNCNHKDISEILNEYLANLKVLNNNLYNLHFNVVGSDFFQVHLKMQEYYEKTAIMYDDIAERIKMLGSYPITSLNTYEQRSTIKSMLSQDYSIKQVFEVVVNDFSYMLEFSNALYVYANEINDANTADLMLDNIKFFEKQLWMLNASLK